MFKGEPLTQKPTTDHQFMVKKYPFDSQQHKQTKHVYQITATIPAFCDSCNKS